VARQAFRLMKEKRTTGAGGETDGTRGARLPQVARLAGSSFHVK
jgi:hypothetical protein